MWFMSFIVLFFFSFLIWFWFISFSYIVLHQFSSCFCYIYRTQRFLLFQASVGYFFSTILNGLGSLFTYQWSLCSSWLHRSFMAPKKAGGSNKGFLQADRDFQDWLDGQYDQDATESVSIDCGYTKNYDSNGCSSDGEDSTSAQWKHLPSHSGKQRKISKRRRRASPVLPPIQYEEPTVSSSAHTKPQPLSWSPRYSDLTARITALEADNKVLLASLDKLTVTVNS